MSHTEGAAKAACQKMPTLSLHFGVPRIMFTITLSNLFSFRIKILCSWAPDTGSIQDILSDDNLLNEFVNNLEELSLKYPVIVVIDFENIISITLHHLLKYGSAKPELFGMILNYSFAVEEQNY